MYSLLERISMWVWKRKIQEAFEEVKILVGQTKQMGTPISQCPFVLKVTRYSQGYT